MGKNIGRENRRTAREKSSTVECCVSDPYTLYTDPYTDPDQAYSNFFGSGSGFSVLILQLHLFVFFKTIFWVF